MVTSVGKEAAVAALVRDLVVLEYDAIAAYEAAMDRLKDGMARDRLADFCEDHRQHIQDLGDWLRARGESPPSQGDLKAVLTQGKVVIGGLIGDRAILQAMHNNEDDTNTAYERAAARDDLDGPLSVLVRANLEDERGHRTWMHTYLLNTSGD